MKLRNKSITTQLTLNILITTLLVFIITIGIIAFFSNSIIGSQAKDVAQSKLDSSIKDIEYTLKPVETLTQNSAWAIESNMDDSVMLFAYTRNILKHNPDIIASFVAFAPGKFKGKEYFSLLSIRRADSIMSSTPDLEAFNYLCMDWFQIPQLTKKPYWIDPSYSADNIITSYSYPIFDGNGEFVAVISNAITLDMIVKKLDSIKPYENSMVSMIGHNGHFISSDSSKLVETIFSYALESGNDTLISISEDIARGKSGMKKLRYKGEIAFDIYGQLNNGWSVSILCLYGEILKSAKLMNRILLLVIFISLMLLIIICRRRILMLTKPIVELSVSAMTMAKGNFDAHIAEIDGNNEIKRLQDSVSYLQKSIKDYISELKITTAQNERIEGELNIAREIQMNMVPRNFPSASDNYGLYALLQPAKEVGGDLYDFVKKDNILRFVIGDVSGKGVPAAMFMAITRAAFRFISGLELSMDQVVNHINNSLSEGNESNMFCTLFMGRVDLETGNMTFCNAGHNPIIVIPPDVEGNDVPRAYYLKAKPNLATGLFADFPYEAESIRLVQGTRLLLYTDGVSEAETSQKELFGDDRLLAWAQTINTPEKKDKTNEELVKDLQSVIKDFTGENEQNDDITIMIIEV